MCRAQSSRTSPCSSAPKRERFPNPLSRTREGFLKHLIHALPPRNHRHPRAAVPTPALLRQNVREIPLRAYLNRASLNLVR